MNINEYLNRKVSIEDDFCFVIMPFDNNLTPIFQNGIKPIVEELKYRCKRSDEHLGSSPIMFDVFDDILRARFIIADLTDSNPNVFYELGIAHALKQNVILLKRAGSNVPFDLAGIRYFEYEDSYKGINDLRTFLTSALKINIQVDQGDMLDKKALKAALKKAYRLWQADGTVIFNFEIFLEIVLDIELLSLSDDEIAFLCHAAAHFGKFMRRMTEKAKENRLAIRVLINEAATGIYTRVPWRAAVMIEKLNPIIVKDEIRKFTDEVKNTMIYPIAIQKNETVSVLTEMISNPLISAEKRDKLAEVMRQIKAEFKD